MSTLLTGELGNLVGDNDPGVRVSAIDAICQYSNSKSNLISVEEGKFSATSTVMVWIEALKKVAECLEDTEVKKKILSNLSTLCFSGGSTVPSAN
jgi:hypothetical protein